MAGELGDWEYDLDTYNYCITLLQRYFSGNKVTSGMKNSFEFDKGTLITTAAEQDIGLCSQTRYELSAIGTKMEYLLAKYLPDNSDIT